MFLLERRIEKGLEKYMETNTSGQDNFSADKFQSLHFGHVAIVLGCAVFLLSISYMKSGFNFNLAKKQSIKKYTYAEAKAKAIAQVGLPSNYGSESKSQLAILDSDFGTGQVAGASINALGDLGIPSADESWTKEELSMIPIKIISDNSSAAFEKYRDSMEAVEINYDLAYIMLALNSDDKAVLKQAGKKAEELVKAALTVEVPSNLSELHRFKNIQFMEMGLLAKSLSGENVGTEPQELSSEIFSVMEKIGRLKTDIFEKYNFEI